MAKRICRESCVNSASWFNDQPLHSRRRRIASANTPHTGSSDVREIDLSPTGRRKNQV
jgi:hypothetical protein